MIAVVDAREVMVGNEALLEEHAVLMADRPVSSGMSVQVAINGRFAGSLQFVDETRPGAADVIRQLKATGIRRVVMLTGDNVDVARRVGHEIGIDDVRAQLLPEDKIREIKRQGDRIIAITWTMNIPPGEFAEFAFVARNPRDQTQLVWTLRQRFADGTVSDWTKGPNGIRPTAITKLAPRPTQ